MKRYIIAGLVVAGLAVGGTAFATPPATVTICHANGKQGMVRIVTNENAINGHFENNGTTKQGHEDDVLKQGEATCDAPVVTPHTPVPCPTGQHKIGTAQNGDDVCEPDAPAKNPDPVVTTPSTTTTVDTDTTVPQFQGK